MISAQEYKNAAARAVAMLSRAGIAVTLQEKQRLEVTDFGLGDLMRTGLQIVVYLNTDRCCAKEIVLFPRQTCPEHWHPAVDRLPGKEETFRSRWGRAYPYVPGEPARHAACRAPAGSEAHYLARREIVLDPGDQYTVPPETPQGFQAGDEAAVVSEFSTHSADERDVFRDPRIVRRPGVEQISLDEAGIELIR